MPETTEIKTTPKRGIRRTAVLTSLLFLLLLAGIFLGKYYFVEKNSINPTNITNSEYAPITPTTIDPNAVPTKIPTPTVNPTITQTELKSGVNKLVLGETEVRITLPAAFILQEVRTVSQYSLVLKNKADTNAYQITLISKAPVNIQYANVTEVQKGLSRGSSVEVPNLWTYTTKVYSTDDCKKFFNGDTKRCGTDTVEGNQQSVSLQCTAVDLKSITVCDSLVKTVVLAKK